MANVVNQQILVDGPNNVVIKVDGLLDTSDVAVTDLADPATLSATIPASNRLRIMLVRFSIEDSLTVNLFWDATSDQPALRLIGRDTLDFTSEGGIRNNAGAGVTGKLQWSTEGFSLGAVLAFSFVVELCKARV